MKNGSATHPKDIITAKPAQCKMVSDLFETIHTRKVAGGTPTFRRYTVFFVYF
jgi:hypothetical protein